MSCLKLLRPRAPILFCKSKKRKRRSSRGWQDGVQVNRQNPKRFEYRTADPGRKRTVGLGENPRLKRIEDLVCQISEKHDPSNDLTEFARLIELGDVRLCVMNVVNERFQSRMVTFLGLSDGIRRCPFDF